MWGGGGAIRAKLNWSMCTGACYVHRLVSNGPMKNVWLKCILLVKLEKVVLKPVTSDRDNPNRRTALGSSLINFLISLVQFNRT